jgi:TATA-box binding protein (TBP) (component of TFIID and TFIIIB)
MITQNQCQEEDNRFQDSFSNFETYNTYFSAPKICMITLVFETDKHQINLEDVRTNQELHIRTKKYPKERKKYRSFLNCVTTIFDEKKAIKVFCNGKMHVTGCCKIAYGFELVNRFAAAMKWDDYSITNYKILTFNTCIKLSSNKYIDLSTFHDILYKKNIQSRYTPDTYQGLVIKIIYKNTDKKISILCFYTGNFIITGVSHPEHLSYGFEFLHNIMKDIYDDIIM